MNKIRYTILLLSILCFLTNLLSLDKVGLDKLKEDYEKGYVTKEEAIWKAQSMGVSLADIEIAEKKHSDKDPNNPSNKKLTPKNDLTEKNDSTQIKLEKESQTSIDKKSSKIVFKTDLNTKSTKQDSISVLKKKKYDETASQDSLSKPQNNTLRPKNEMIDSDGYYGYGLFNQQAADYNITASGPVDPDYRLGAGDEIIVSVWGDVEFRDLLTVSQDGTILLDKAGLISVNGLSVKDLEIKLKNYLSKVYSTINTAYPTTFIDVSLGKLRPITVFFVGEVSKVGAYQLDSYSTAFSALYKVGGPTNRGSLREIELIRDGKTISKIDLYDYLLSGKKVKDLRLQHGDHIFVPTRQSTVTLKGEVNNPAIYELTKGETLTDLIKYAGGLLTTTDIKRVQIERIIPFEERKDQENLIDIQDYPLKKGSGINPIKLVDCDIVTIFPLLDKIRSWAEISGSIYRPGKYAVTPKLTLKELIKNGGDILPEAFLDKADLVRTYLNGETKFFSIDLNSTAIDTFKVKDLDHLKIYSRWEVEKRGKFVDIDGHVTQPGRYSMQENMSLKDLLFKAGGLNDEIFKKNAYLVRADLIRYNEDQLTTKVIPIKLDSLLSGNESYNLILNHRDRVEIYNSSVNFFPSTVRIEGAVKNPGVYDLQTNMVLHDLIVRANGFNKNAYMYELEIYRVDPYNVTKEKMAIRHTVKINPQLLAEFKSSADFKLEDKDLVVVREHPNFQYQQAIAISGAVKYPGTYVLLHQNETFKEVINRAGGLKEEALVEGIVIKRDEAKIGADFESMLNSFWRDYDISLKDGDKITIPVQPKMVTVKGFVNNPCQVQHRPDWSLSDYIAAAGGYKIAETEKMSDVFVTYASGLSKVDGWIFSPTVKDGSTITVNSMAYEPKKTLEYIKEWTSISGSLATVIVAIAFMLK